MRAYVNLRHIRLFEAAVRLGSLSEAAEVVLISQPAASQAVARLEDFFGGKLIERRKYGIAPTPKGEIVVARARRALELLRAASLRFARQAKPAQPAKPELLETHASMAQLRALAAFAEMGSFSAAARHLGQTEPSVQRAARELERIAGVALFSGGKRMLRLTPTGQMLATQASLVLKELDSALAQVREAEGRFDGRIVVGTLPLVRTRIVPAAVVALTRKWPEARIEIIDGPYDSLLQGLKFGQIDMLVGALREEPGRLGVVQETLFSDGLSIIARAGHPLAGRKEISPSDLARYQWVLSRPGTPSRVIFDKLAAEFPPGPHSAGIVETGSLIALRGILLQSDRLTILSRRQVLYEEQAGLFTVLPFDLDGTQRPIGLTTRVDWMPTALQADFVAALREVAAE